jgi:Flp pilus assembly protein TadD
MLKLVSMRAPLAAMLAVGMIMAGVPAVAQQVMAETPGAALQRSIRVLAASPRDFSALIGAGQAALELGDVQAAAGFFGRAEEVNPSAPAAKVGLGAAMAHMGDPDGAIFYFNQASRLGAQPMTMAVDRGMARDLLGDLSGAQADYRLAIASLGSDEARRRLALSLAIARDKKGALDTLQPLLNRHDAAAQRTRAFVLALLGDQIGAAEAIDSVMPGTGARFAPFFRYLPNLSVTQKAAAVHLGIFPENAGVQIAQAQPAPQPAPVIARPTQPIPQPPVKIASVEPPVISPPAAAPAFTLPSARTGSASPSFSLPSAKNAAPTATVEASAEPKPDALEPAPALAEAEEVAAEGNLTGIDKLLETLAEAPPVAPAKVEAKRPSDASFSKSARGAKAAAEKAAEKKQRDAQLAAEKKAKEEAAKLGIAGTNWVQLAGGSNQDRMVTEYKRLSAKAGRLLKSRSGYVTGGKDYFRLLVGPFDSKSDSQSFVNKLEKEGVDGFSWTRTPAQIRIEKLSSR